MWPGKCGAIELVDGVLADPETSALSDQEKALFRFVRKVNFDSVNIGPADIEALHQVGYTDEADLLRADGVRAVQLL